MSSDDLIFIPARDELRIKQDDREEIIRLVRDITSYSKKCIFSCHRSIGLKKLKSELLEYFKILSDRLKKIRIMYITNLHLRGNISGAIEELIEFFTFAYFKNTGKLLPYNDFIIMIKCLILEKFEFIDYLIEDKELEKVDDEIEIDFIDTSDYLMGLFDCTGEIMRLSISQSTNTSGNFKAKETWENYKFLQKLYEQFIILVQLYPGISIYKGIYDNSINSKGSISFKKKLEVFESSVKKIEATLIDMLVSDKEII
ncbi:unnamed protein product [Candida verbasci]|uniref:Translin n=1 Tax=Candida verbasci TaxID=1227364 RepID=A0A9W4TZ56_9ASCO|nr:unnamed protein product [Candida verbasci]